MSDPILESMFEGVPMKREKVERGQIDPEYGKGRWPNAILTEVTSQAANEYGHSFMLKANLKGEEGMPFTFFVEAPIKPVNGSAEDEKAFKRYQLNLNRLKTLIHATGFLVIFDKRGYVSDTDWPDDGSLDDFSTDESYAKLIGIFERLVGSKMGLNVKYYERANGKLAKDVWGLDPRKEV